MKTSSALHLVIRLFLCLLPSAFCLAAEPVGTAFTYQGQLLDGGQSASGSYDLKFTLYDAAAFGGVVAGPTTNSPVVVSNGLFTVTLDFGAPAFDGNARWLDIGVRTNGSVTEFTPLTPRQALTPTPHAIAAQNLTATLPAAQLTGALPSAQLVGTYTGAITLNNAANSFTGSGAGLTSLNASRLSSGTVPDGRLSANVARTSQVWLLGGNAGTKPDADFLGTTDNQPLELKVNGLRALRVEFGGDSNDPDTVPDGAPNVIGGSPVNSVAAGVVGATISGGGATNWNGVVYPNLVAADYATIGGGVDNTIRTNALCAIIGGGYNNTIETNSTHATISGGYYNTIQPAAGYATIGGGDGNTIQTNSTHATIGGGMDNTIQPAAGYATIGGGVNNTIQADADSATIGGGYYNTIQTNADFATIGGGAINTIQTNALCAIIGGGRNNTIQTNAAYATIGGGFYNAIQTNALCATIPGGRDNEATNYAFAAGYNAHALHTGAFVWSDSGGTDTASTNDNSVTFRARGGYRFMTSSANNIGAYLAAGSGTWNSLSDRNAKENFEPINPQEVLDKVAALPVSRWNYRSQPACVRHLGPTAQDFHAAFQVGDTDLGISSVDADGVALAAIQGLNQKVEDRSQRSEVRSQQLEERLQQKETEITELKARLTRLEAMLLRPVDQTSVDKP